MRAIAAEKRAFESWQDYQDALKRAIVPLTEEQLQRRLLPGLRSPGEIAEHIVFGRALHLYHTLGEKVADLKPLHRWDDDDDLPHTAVEIVQGLDLTWRYITDCLMSGSSADELPPEKAEIVQTIWGLLDHDLPHAGELSLLLGARAERPLQRLSGFMARYSKLLVAVVLLVLGGLVVSNALADL